MAPPNIQKKILADWFLPPYEESYLNLNPRLADADATEQVCEECQATLHRRVADAAAIEKLCEKFQATLQSRVADVIQQVCEEFKATLPHMVADAIQTGVQQSAQAKANHDVATTPQRHRNPLFVVTDDTDTESEDSSLVEEDFLHLHHNREHWDSDFENEMPEFHGGVASEEAFLNWLFRIKEIFFLKKVPENRRVSLVSTCFRGHAAAWWNQFNLQRSGYGKEKLTSWDKLKKHMRKAFLPYSIRQGSRTVDEYASEFFQLMSLIDDKEVSEDQLVVRFISGLEPKLKTMLEQFDPVTVSEAHQRAVVMEKQTRGGTSVWDFFFR